MNLQILWLRKNLFSTWYNSLLTVIFSVFLFLVVRKVLIWAITQAQWAVVQVNLPLFLVGRFPQSLYWRIWIVLAIAATLTAISLGVFSENQRLTKRDFVISALIVSVLLVVLPVALIP